MQVDGHSLSIYILTLETSFSPVTSNTIITRCLFYWDLQLWILPWATIYIFTCLIWNLHLKVVQLSQLFNVQYWAPACHSFPNLLVPISYLSYWYHHSTSCSSKNLGIILDSIFLHLHIQSLSAHVTPLRNHISALNALFPMIDLSLEAEKQFHFISRVQLIIFASFSYLVSFFLLWSSTFHSSFNSQRYLLKISARSCHSLL